MQGHPYLGDGEGGAGVLLTVAGSLMREGLTSVSAAIQALSHPISVRLTVRAVATPLGLRSTCLCGQHAAQAWLVAGGGGLHRELVVLVPYFESLAEVHFGEGILQALHEVKCVLLAIKDSLVIHIFFDVISFI